MSAPTIDAVTSAATPAPGTGPGSREVGVPSPPRVAVLHHGPVTHGVTQFGIELARALRAVGAEVREDWTVPCMESPETSAPEDADVVHLQFTDNVWGDDAEAAARNLRSVRGDLAGPVVATVHDLPDPHDRPARWRRRATAYRAVAESVDHVVVCSRHERDRLRRTGASVPITVVPNPVPYLPEADDDAVRACLAGLRRDLDQRVVVGLLGWVHPGKRYDTVVRELADTEVGLAVLGGPARGHEGDMADLRRQAERAGLPMVVTGWLDDHRQVAAMAAVDHAVVSHPRPSASGSALAWIAAGREPWVRTSGYAHELRSRAGGRVHLWRAGTLSGSLPGHPRSPVHARDDVGSDHELSPTTAARRHLDVYQRL